MSATPFKDRKLAGIGRDIIADLIPGEPGDGLGAGGVYGIVMMEARAKGGDGTMLIARCQVVPAPLMPPGWFIEAYNPHHIPSTRRIVDASPKHGAKIAVQIGREDVRIP